MNPYKGGHGRLRSGYDPRGDQDDQDLDHERRTEMSTSTTASTTKARIVPQAEWGRDHESTTLYVESRCVDYGGVPHYPHMRCDPDLHPAYAHSGSYGRKHPTRLAEGKEEDNHDDWSCVDDLEAAGLVVIDGTGVRPVWSLTDAGWAHVSKLRRTVAERRLKGLRDKLAAGSDAETTNDAETAS